MPISIFKNGYEFNKKKWVISILNTGSPFTGHAVLLLEGLKLDGTLFVVRYDIQAELWRESQSSVNKKGYISEIRCIENPRHVGEYKKYTHNSFYISNVRKAGETQSEVEKLIAGIEEDRCRVEAYKKYVADGKKPTATVEPVLYQFLGKQGCCVDPDDGDNCAGWCLDKLEAAGVKGVDDIYGKKPIIAANGWLASISKYRRALFFSAATGVGIVAAAYLAASDSEAAKDIRKIFL